jgi:predicted ATPase
MIRELRLQNFKAHQSTTIDLARLTLLVGANGVGKTSVLEALAYLSQLWRRSPKDLFVDAHAPRTFVRNPSLPVSLHASHVRADGDPNEVYLRVDLGAADRGPAGGDRIPASGDQWTAAGEVGPGGPKINETETFLAKAPSHPLYAEASSAELYRLDARAIAQPGYTEDNVARVRFDGANTAAVIASWKLDDDERLAKTVRDLQSIVPQVRSVRVRQHADAARRTTNGFSLFFDFDDAQEVPATSVSEGTLVALAILTALNAKTQPHLVLLDDLGAELHPTAQGDLVRLLQAILDLNPRLQIVASTHSPYILDATLPSNVRVFARAADGSAHVRRLDQHPDARRTEGLTTGQLWALDPETWVLEAAP